MGIKQNICSRVTTEYILCGHPFHNGNPYNGYFTPCNSLYLPIIWLMIIPQYVWRTHVLTLTPMGILAWIQDVSTLRIGRCLRLSCLAVDPSEFFTPQNVKVNWYHPLCKNQRKTLLKHIETMVHMQVQSTSEWWYFSISHIIHL